MWRKKHHHFDGKGVWGMNTMDPISSCENSWHCQTDHPVTTNHKRKASLKALQIYMPKFFECTVEYLRRLWVPRGLANVSVWKTQKVSFHFYSVQYCCKGFQKALSNICVAVLCGLRTDVSTSWCALCEKQLQAPLILWWCLEFTQAPSIHTLKTFCHFTVTTRTLFLCCKSSSFATTNLKQKRSHPYETLHKYQILGPSRLGDHCKQPKPGETSTDRFNLFFFSQQGGVVSLSTLIVFTWAISRSSLCLYLFATHHCVRYYCALWVTPLGIPQCVFANSTTAERMPRPFAYMAHHLASEGTSH